MAQFKKNETVTCKVTAVEKDGIEVEVSEGVRSFIKRAELSRDRQDQRPERFAVGDRVDAQIVSSDKKTGKVQLSIKALELADHKRAIEEFGSSDSGASLGDILGAALEEATTGGKKKAKKSKKAVDEDEEV
jgi:small subunit ribosomal protein S1